MGCNLFAKFSAYIKNTQKEANKRKIPLNFCFSHTFADSHSVTQLKWDFREYVVSVGEYTFPLILSSLL